MTKRNTIPPGVIAAVSDALAAQYTHTGLNGLFMRAGAPGDAPLGNKVEKCRAWLRAINADQTRDPHQVLGELIGEVMDSEVSMDLPEIREASERRRTDIRGALAKYGLSY